MNRFCSNQSSCNLTLTAAFVYQNADVSPIAFELPSAEFAQ